MTILRVPILKCRKCGKKLEYGKDGACPKCSATLCWECWKNSEHTCPLCEKGNNLRQQANYEPERHRYDRKNTANSFSVAWAGDWFTHRCIVALRMAGNTVRVMGMRGRESANG